MEMLKDKDYTLINCITEILRNNSSLIQIKSEDNNSQDIPVLLQSNYEKAAFEIEKLLVLCLQINKSEEKPVSENLTLSKNNSQGENPFGK